MIDKDFLAAFREETNGLLVELKAIIEKLEDDDFVSFPAELFSEFSQKIDRIMGAAKTIAMDDPSHAGLMWIGRLAEVCKALGYKVQGQSNLKLIPIFSAFWADTIEAIEELMGLLESPADSAKAAAEFLPTLQSRLQWLLSKIGGPGGPANQADVDALMKSLGK